MTLWALCFLGFVHLCLANTATPSGRQPLRCFVGVPSCGGPVVHPSTARSTVVSATHTTHTTAPPQSTPTPTSIFVPSPADPAPIQTTPHIETTPQGRTQTVLVVPTPHQEAKTETVLVTPTSTAQESLNASSSPSPSQSTTAPAQNRTHLNGGIITGLAIGGISGIGFLALGAYLLFRRKRRQISSRPIDPFADAPSRETAGVLSVEKDAEVEALIANEKGQMANLQPPLEPVPIEAHRHLSFAATSMSGQTPPPPPSGSSDAGTGIETGVGTGSIDILRLFEDRTFEPHLLRLISQRMDPAPNFGGEAGSEGSQWNDHDGLPAYPHANEES